MTSISSLRPNVTREEAVCHFAGRGLRKLTRRLCRGPLHSTADIYVPFAVFRVHVDTGRSRQASIFGVDLVRGDFDLYGFERDPAGSLITVETRNCAPPLLSSADARQALVAQVRRLVFSRGFFRLQHFQISAESLLPDVHVPYWVGVWRHGEFADFALLDAVRRRPEGAKMRTFVREWLQSNALAANAAGNRTIA